MRKHLSTLIKLAITVIGLGIVLTKFDAQKIMVTLINANMGWLLVGFALVNASLVLRAFRWLLLLRGLKTDVAFGRLIELYFVGSFFNAFLPSGFGGDVVRVVEVSRDVPTSVATGTVIVDRLTGLMMLFTLALLALPFRPQDFPSEIFWLIVIVCSFGLLMGGVVLEGSLLRRFIQMLPAKIAGLGDGFLAKVTQAVDECGWQAIFGAFAVSIVFNLVQAAWWTTSAWALGLDVAYSYFLLVVPILALILLVPSIGGLGVRELVAAPLFAGAGLSPENAVALTFLVFALERVSGLLGGFVYLFAILRDRRQATAV